jgi:hypothetical protein
MKELRSGVAKEHCNSSDLEVRTAFLEALQSFRELVNSNAVAAAWQGPSALAGYTVAGLVGHVLSAVLAVERCLDLEPGTEAPIARGMYYASVPSPHDASDLIAKSVREAKAWVRAANEPPSRTSTPSDRDCGRDSPSSQHLGRSRLCARTP